MPDPTPAAAAPAATPAAAPAASAPVTPAPAAPAAAPVTSAAAAPAASTEGSLLLAEPPAVVTVPQTEEEKIAAAKEVIRKAEEAADPNGGKAWLLTDGVQGQGEKPAWLNTSKYKSVAAQAEAYSHLEPRFGSFVGAPKEGKYEFTLNEALKGKAELNADHPLLAGFTKWAQENQLNQTGYNELLNRLVEYQVTSEAARNPTLAQLKESLGDNADARITAVSQWGKANFDDAGYKALTAAVSGKNAASVFQVLEKIIGKTAQARMPKPGEDVRGAQVGGGLEAIQAMQAEKDPKTGVRLYVTSAEHRQKVERLYTEYYAAQAQ